MWHTTKLNLTNSASQSSDFINDLYLQDKSIEMTIELMRKQLEVPNSRNYFKFLTKKKMTVLSNTNRELNVPERARGDTKLFEL